MFTQARGRRKHNRRGIRGHNLIAENGVLLAESPLFRDGLLTADADLGRLAFERRKNTSFLPNGEEAEQVRFELPVAPTPLTRSFPKTPFVPSGKADRDSRCETILAMQSAGLKKGLRIRTPKRR